MPDLHAAAQRPTSSKQRGQRSVSTPAARKALSREQDRLVKRSQEANHTPAPGTYNIIERPGSAPSGDRGSAWAKSGVKRIPRQAVTLATSDPGLYEKTDLGGVATVASAEQSPSIRARRGDASFSSFSTRMLQENGPNTPGPGAYTIPRPASAGGDLGSTAFRARTQQRPQPRRMQTPPPGAYQRVRANIPEAGGATPAFRSKVDRFGRTRRTTAGAAVGPGRYDPSTALTHPSSKAMSFGTSSDRFAATPEEREAARIPAPGTYDLFDKDTRLVRDHETNKVVARRPDPSPWLGLASRTGATQLHAPPTCRVSPPPRLTGHAPA